MHKGLGADQNGSAAATAIGIDLGGTKVNGVIIDERGLVLTRVRAAHGGGGASALDAAMDVVGGLAINPDFPAADRVGMAIAGLVDRRTDELVHGALLDLRESRLRELVSARSGLPLVVENDANATLAGVLSQLPPRDPQSVALLVAIGTGVGGALSIGDTILEGSAGFAGEFGHIPIEAPGMHQCPCGSSGCLELFASGPSVARAAEGRWSRGGEPTTAENVVGAALDGDVDARALLTSAGHAIAAGLTGLISAVDPSTIYISGGFGHAAAPFLIPAIEERLQRQRSFGASRPAPQIIPDPVGPIAAALGAARLAQLRLPTPAQLVHSERTPS